MEIERRWLTDGWPEGTPSARWHMDQGYLCTRPAVRIRREAREGGETRYVLCVKGGGGLVREEVELPLSGADYARLAALLSGPMIQKEQRRYPLPGGLTLEVNAVDPALETGFFYAEVEFPTEAAARAWAPPEAWADYLSRETTGQPGESMAAYWARTRPCP